MARLLSYCENYGARGVLSQSIRVIVHLIEEHLRSKCTSAIWYLHPSPDSIYEMRKTLFCDDFRLTEAHKLE